MNSKVLNYIILKSIIILYTIAITNCQGVQKMQEKRNIQTKTGANVKDGSGVAQKKQPNGSHKGGGTTATLKKSTTSSSKKTQGSFLQGCLGCFGILLLIGIVAIVIFAMFGKDDQPSGQQLAASNSYKGGLSANGEFASQVKSLIIKAVGEATNMGEPKIIDLQVNDHEGTVNPGDKIVVATLLGNDNLSSNMIKGGMQLESIEIFRALFERSEIEEAALIWQFPTQSDYGNSELNTVLKITVTKATAEQINWSDFDKDNFTNVADSYWEHPSMRE